MNGRIVAEVMQAAEAIATETRGWLTTAIHERWIPTIVGVRPGNSSLEAVAYRSPVLSKLIADYGDPVLTSSESALSRISRRAFSSNPLPGSFPLDAAGDRSGVTDVVRKLAVAEAHALIPINCQALKDTHSLVQLKANRQIHALVREASFLRDIQDLPLFAESMKSWSARWEETERMSGRVTSRVEFDARSETTESVDRYLSALADPASLTLKSRAVLSHTKAGDVVFDMGAGGGDLAMAVAHNRPGANVFALDLSPGVIDSLVRRRAERSPVLGGSSFKVLEANAINPPLPPSSVDVINSASNLHEIVSYGSLQFGTFNRAAADAAVGKWLTALRADGRLVLNDFLRPDDGPAWTIAFKSPEVRAYFDLFVKGQPGYGTSEQGIFPAVKFQGRQLQFTENADATVTMPPADAWEFLAHSRWDMSNLSSHLSDANEQFMNFTSADYQDLVTRNVPPGYAIKVLESSSNSPQHYVDHINSVATIYRAGSDGRMQRLREFPDMKKVLVVQKVRDSKETADLESIWQSR